MTTRAGWWSHCVAVATAVLLVGGGHAGCAPPADDRATNVAASTQEGAASSGPVDLGDNHGCLIRRDGNVYCWGANDHGQMGNGTISSSPQIGARAVTGL